jgi:hypothetical protein
MLDLGPNAALNLIWSEVSSEIWLIDSTGFLENGRRDNALDGAHALPLCSRAE